MIERVMEVCGVCGSDFGNGEEKVECLRIPMPHCSAFYACVCLDCAREISWAHDEAEH